MKIYTRTGDHGETALFGGGRVPKAHPRVEAYGAVDELNAVIGLAVAELDHDGDVARTLTGVQHDLFAVGAHLATPPPREGRREPRGLPPLPDTRIPELERAIDAAEAELPELRAFILPGGCRAGAMLHHARTVGRRAERRITTLAGVDPVPGAVLAYVNRLSDLLFVFARLVNRRADVAEVEWRKGGERGG